MKIWSFLMLTLFLTLPLVAQDIRVYREVDGKPLRAYVFAPPPHGAPATAVLLFHPGGWAEGSPRIDFDAAQRFARAGFVAIPVEYRLASETVTPIESLGDVCSSIGWVRAHARELGIDAHHIVAYGESAGGQLAAASGTIGCGSRASEPDALLLVSPMLDVANEVRFVPLLRGRAPAEAYSPLAHVRKTTPPTLIIAGAKDDVAPLATSQRFCDALKAAHVRCELHVYDGVGHLLTRDLKEQEADIDPDPKAEADAEARELAFLRSLQQRLRRTRLWIRVLRRLRDSG